MFDNESYQEEIISKQYKKEKEYWLNKLSGDLVKSTFPCDVIKLSPQKESGTDTAAKVIFRIEGELYQKLIKLSNQSHFRLHIILTSILVILLNKYTGENDIIIGAPVLAQKVAEKFVNSILVLRNRVESDMTFKELLIQVWQTMTAAIENVNYPMKMLLYHLKMPFSRDTFPLFDVAVLLENIHDKNYLRDIRLNMIFNFRETGEYIECTVEHNGQLYERAAVEKIISHFNSIMGRGFGDIGMKIGKMDILTVEEKKLLAHFNDTNVNYPGDKTIHELFEKQVEMTPDRTALVYKDQHLTYRELNRQTNRLARLLRKKGVQPDGIVGLMISRSPDMIIAMLGILKAGGAYLAIDKDVPMNRITAILEDSGVTLLITDLERMGNAQAVMFEELKKIFAGEPGLNLPPVNHVKNLAYVIFTSGSSGKPKGVMVEHRGLVNYTCWAAQQYVKNERVNFPLYTPVSFDLTVTSIFTPLITGNAIIVLGEEEKELVIDKIIENTNIGVIKLTPAHLTMMRGKKIGSHSHVRRLIVGGEQLESSLARDITGSFAGDIEIYNEYGPTEAVVGCMIHRFNPLEDQGESVPIGSPIHNAQIYILDKDLHPVPDGVSGEIFIGGHCLARGYLNNPGLTSEKFDQDLWDEKDGQDESGALRANFQHSAFIIPHSNLYCTGDLARRLKNGNIEFLGRIDKQIKIRGYRVELGEIENRLMSHKKINDAAVVVKEDGAGDKYLAAYVVLYPGPGEKEPGVEVKELKEYLAQTLPDYMIPGFITFLGKIPLNSNGKVDIKKLPEVSYDFRIIYTPPRNDREKKMVEIWARNLGIPADKISIDANYFELGGHSLKATLLLSLIHKEFDVRLPLSEIFERPTIRELAEFFQNTVTEQFISIEPAEKKDYYGLSSAQRRLFVLQQMEQESTAYNIRVAVELEGETGKEKLEQAFGKLIARHESLRTSFGIQNGVPYQRIHDKEQLAFEIEYYDHVTSSVEVEKIAQDFDRAFDFSKAPLIRVGLVKMSHIRHILLVNMAHIITDGISHNILIKDLSALYNGRELPPLELQYKDFSEWEQNESSREMFQEQEKYWLKEFTGEIPVLNLPYDFPRPTRKSFAGKAVDFEVSDAETKALREISRSQGVTPFMALMAIYDIFLSKLSSREDITVGTPIAGRRHADLQKIIGMFVNTLPVRQYPAAEKTFTGFLQEVKKITLQTLENQDYPFEKLVEKITGERDMSRENPLFDVLFHLQNIPVSTGEPEVESMAEIKIKPFDPRNKTTKYDLVLNTFESEERLFFSFSYSTFLFRDETILRFVQYFKKIISSVMENPGKKIAEISIIPGEEKQRLLYDFNDTGAFYPQDKTIHQLFEEQAVQTPDHVAVFSHGQTRTNTDNNITYFELNEQSDRLAGLLIEKGVLPDNIIGIMMERSVEMIVGIFGILKAGGAYLPIDPEYPGERIHYMLKDSATKLLVTTKNKEIEELRQWKGEKVFLESICHPSNYFSFQHSAFSARAFTHSNHLAYVIYTSGSTGKPKGVLITHKNVVRLMVNDKFQFDFSSRDVWTMFHSYCFDFSVWEMYGALLYGGKLVIMPGAVARDTEKFLEVLKNEKVTVLNQTPSAFYNLAELELRQSAGELNLGYVIFGGDALNPARLKEWKAAYPKTRLINMYGITETTVHVTFKEIHEQDMAGDISNIGKPIPTLKTYSMNSYLTLQPLGTPGECMVGGDGVGNGYLNRPELTAEKFIDNPYKTGETLYRSGDLVKIRTDSEMEYIGRIDQQVKIRGFRVELGEIENRLLELDNVNKAVVLEKTGGNSEKYLCAYIVSPMPMNLAGLREILSHKLPAYMIPSYFVQLDNIPLTANGKIDAQALRKMAEEMHTGEEFDFAAPRDHVESKLAEIWAEVLGIVEHRISTKISFFELGGHSLNALKLLSLIHKAFNVKVSLGKMFINPSIRELAGLIKGLTENKYASIEPTEKKEYYPLSSAQERLYILQKMDPENTAYNLPYIIPLAEEYAAEKLEQVFIQLIQRHESLRTSFYIINEEPVQRVHDKVDFEIENRAANNAKEREEVQHFIRPFELSHAPLLRVTIVDGESSHPILLIDMHHIITDGISQNILEKEFFALYLGKELPGLRLQYKDFSQWRRSLQQEDFNKQQETYWLNVFSGDIPALMLPLDFPRPAVQSFEGDTLGFELTTEQTRLLKRLAESDGATLYMMLLAVFNVFLSKITSQEDIVVGTPIAARRHPDLARIIGMFVNTLALRNYPVDQKSFKQFLGEVKKHAMDAFGYQEYSFEELVNKVSNQRDISRNPLFDVMFSYQNLDTDLGYHTSGDTKSPQREEDRNTTQTSMFDLTLFGMEINDRLVFRFRYCTKLFKSSTVKRFTGYFKNLLMAVSANVWAQLFQLDIISEDEKKKILYDFNETRKDFCQENTVHQLFIEQAARTPDHIAVIGPGGMSITYEELNRKSNQLAHLLREKGVEPDMVVAIMAERSVEMVVGLMGILKSGGAYMPIDPRYPQERIDYMLKDSGAKLLAVANDQEGEKVRKWEGEKVLLESILHPANHLFYQHSAFELPRILHSNHLCYIIYTSGSTGKPKGVMIAHNALVNRLNWMQRNYPIGPGDVILQKTTFTFDVSVWELFWWSWYGAALRLLYPGGEKNPRAIVESCEKSKVTLLHFVPSMLSVFLEYLELSGSSAKLKSLARVFASGEALELRQVERFNRLLCLANGTVLTNLYGPTEAAIDVSYFNCVPGELFERIPIGKPIDNTQLYIVNNRLLPQPVGIAGELCIGGVGLAWGYLNRPELTAERFVKCYRSYRSYKTHILYKTGDLARWLDDGNIEFLGRIDSQVKLRGYRIELAEIEGRLLQYPDIREALVVTKGKGFNDRYLCAYIVPGLKCDVEKLRTYLTQSLPDYMIPSAIIKIDRIPLTPGGKIDRSALPAPAIKDGEEHRNTAPRSRIEEKLAALWQDVLKGQAPVGIDDNFFKLGGHSLKAAVLTAKIHKFMDVEISLAEVFKKPTIRQMAQYISEAKKNIYKEIKPIEKRDYYPQSSAQKRLFFLDHFETIGTTYNMPSVFTISGNIEKEALENAFKKLIMRHETLRTSFHLIDGQPVQRVHDPADINFEFQRLKDEKTPIENFIRPFDLSKAPLFRAGIVELSSGELLLLLDMHHIVVDGTSRGIMIDDFICLYAGEKLPFLKVQYKEFSFWQNNLFETGKISEQEQYWRNLFNENVPRLNLVGDYPRPPVFRFDGDQYDFDLEMGESVKFKALNPELNATLFMKLLAVFYILLYKYTGQEDIVIGSGITGRHHGDLDNIIGMFVNTLALRNFPAGQKTWSEFLEEVKNSSLDAFDNQDLQFEELVDILEPERDPSRSPIFDVSLVVQNFEQPKKEMKGVTVSSYGFQPKTTKFDMTLFAMEMGEDIHFSLEYCTALFKEETIKRFAHHLLNIAGYINRNPNTLLADIDILATEEKQQLLFDFNETGADYPKEKTIHELFAGQVIQRPHKIVVVLNDKSVTYSFIEERANQLANYLFFEKSILVGELLGILMDRDIELVIAILGVLQAGGAYVPLDPGLPESRIKRIINDGQIKIIVAQKKYIKQLNRLQWECSCFHTFLCPDSRDIYREQETEKSGLMDQKLWEYVGETSGDDIAGGGWVSSYTGEPFSRQEMDEYGDNIFKKLTPLFHPRLRVLEIGCASGISMFRIAPKVGLYYGTDLSSVIIRKNRARVKEEGHRNIELECLAAHEIDRLNGKIFDLVIINSVIQAFHGHNYLRQVIAGAVDLLEETGTLFIGDVMDQDLKGALILDMINFKTANKGKNYITKTQFSEELFVSRGFFEDMAIEIPAIRGVEFSRKIYTIENELTKFRYDALLTIDKTSKSDGILKKKRKCQHDLKQLREYGTNPVTSGVKPGNPAYVIYTSGTTGVPRGVVVEHQSLVNYAYWRKNAYNFTPSDVALQMISPTFDGFASNLYPCLFTGGSVILADTEKILDYNYINKIIRDERVTNFSIVPPMFQVILEGDDKSGDNLKSVRFVVLAGERTGEKLLRKSMERYPNILYINEYGPTETTVAAAANTKMTVENIDIIGTPVSNTHIYILSIYTNLEFVPIGVPGELCISGSGVSWGYLNHPELTAQKFIRLNPVIPGERILPMSYSYRTGDRCRWIVNGTIEFLGRIDRQVKIRGYRIELGEIESHLLKLPIVKDACVIAWDDGGGDDYICAYIVLNVDSVVEGSSELDIPLLKESLAAELPEYMLPSHFLQIEKIPLTPNGKVDRKVLSSPLQDSPNNGRILTVPRDEIEEKLAAIWSEVLGIEKSKIGIDSDFFQLGGHSLRMTVQAAKVHKIFNVNIPLADLFRQTTIRQLSQYIKGTKAEKFSPIQPGEKREYYPLSSAQKRLYLVQQMDPDTTAYNTPEAIILEKEPDIQRLAEAFKRLFQRHEILRTSFEMVEEGPVQRIHECAAVKIESLATVGDINDFVRPFDLSRAPMLRIGLLKEANGKCLLILDMHHIITDGTSQRVLKKEFIALEAGEQLPPLKIQYKDFSLWQNNQMKSMAMICREKYWLKEFAENIPVLNLPIDYERTANRDYQGDMVAFKISKEETAALKNMALKSEATLYMVLLALYNIFLAKICNQEDILVGTPIAGRTHADLEQTIGMFVNVIVLKNNPRGNETFDEFLAEVKEKTINAFENQDYPFDLLVERFGGNRDLNRNPLVETHFVWHDRGAENDQVEGETQNDENKNNEEKIFESFEIKKTKLEITLVATAGSGGMITCQIYYMTRLFERSTIEKFCRYFMNILETVIKQPQIKLNEIELVTEEDKDRMAALNRQNKRVFSRFKEEGFNEDF